MSQDEPVEANRPAAEGTNGILARLREFTTDALRYWEIRRLYYNLLLALDVLGHFIAYWPTSRSVLSFDAILGLFVLAVLANVAYSAVYIVDVFGQLSGFRDSRRVWRRGVLLVGFAFAAVLAHFFSRGLFTGHGPP